MYYALNRSSFSGATLSGGYSKEAAAKRFTQSSIDRLREFQSPSLSVELADFRDSLAKHDDNTFIYADPPYAINNPVLYGENGSTHKGFDHLGFAEAIKKKNNWIVSYNDSKYIRELYQGYEIIETGWSYGMHGGHAKEGDLTNTSSEIIILNGIDPDHIAAANEKVQQMRSEELEKKRRAADKKFKKLFKNIVLHSLITIPFITFGCYCVSSYGILPIRFERELPSRLERAVHQILQVFCKRGI